ncbi:hypothetical protein PTH_0434 [Pelotomaculum thermopropionicum SI]|uniref:Uncharacterized protein n=1 Tax=Pelotomaculum thermopropionicum (strain DSM 13744 / JCM 10971 / SI) TaxID=370438 RepID=A5D550_PELTS|nr:hypothetical protein PTH_0434 [Pelotomaculum thermopropionicum SI]
MSLTQSAAIIGQELINSLKARLEHLEAMQDEVLQLLAKYNQERQALAGEIKKILADDRLARLEEVGRLLGSFAEDRAGAQKIWQETQEALNSIRTLKKR